MQLITLKQKLTGLAQKVNIVYVLVVGGTDRFGAISLLAMLIKV